MRFAQARPVETQPWCAYWGCVKRLLIICGASTVFIHYLNISKPSCSNIKFWSRLRTHLGRRGRKKKKKFGVELRVVNFKTLLMCVCVFFFLKIKLWVRKLSVFCRGMVIGQPIVGFTLSWADVWIWGICFQSQRMKARGRAREREAQTCALGVATSPHGPVCLWPHSDQTTHELFTPRSLSASFTAARLSKDALGAGRATSSILWD